MSDRAEEFTGEPQDLHDQSVTEEPEVSATMEVPPVNPEADNVEVDHTEVDHADVDDAEAHGAEVEHIEDETEVGHEVAPPRDAHHEGSVAYYAQLPTAEGALSVGVACDVRERPLPFPPLPQDGSAVEDVGSARYEEMPKYEGAESGVSGGDSVTSLEALGSAAYHNSLTSVAAARQPTQGTQVDADMDVTERHLQRGGVDLDDASAPAANSSRDSTSAVDDSASPNATEQRPAAPPSWSLFPQAPHGKVEVTATLLPMQTVVRLTVPVHSSKEYRPTDSSPAVGTASGQGDSLGTSAAPHWVLLAKDLFEGVAGKLLVHPETIRLFHRHKRVRFMETLFLDCDVTSAVASSSRAVDATGYVADSTVNDRAEPIWISVTFPSAEGAGRAGADDSNSEGEEAQASLMAVPPHLFGLGPNDYIVRCIRVRPQKLEIPLQALVEGRSQGYSYDDVIRRLQLLHDAQQLPGSHGGGDDSGEGESAVVPSPNFTIVTVLQDGAVATGKPFLGGYRDRRHPEKVRLHASTQLYHRDLDYSPFAGTSGFSGNRCTRQTQTIGISRSCQTHREACVQTPRIDLDLDTAHDFIVVARPYFTALELHVLRVEMSIIIQKMYRQWKARRIRAELEVAEAARQHRAGARQRREEALQMAVEDAAQLRRDDPRSAADFERLKQEIWDWRREEAARIQRNQSLSPAQIRAALLALTETELQLLQQLDQRRREVGRSRQEKRFLQTLNRMAAPKKWGAAHVHTPETVRAAELRALYDRLCITSSGSTAAAKAVASSSSPAQGIPGASSSPTSAIHTAGNVVHTPATATSSPCANTAATGSAPAPTATVNSAVAGLSSATAARLDILLRVKWTVREFDTGSQLTQELCELIDREADLLHRGRREASLTSLRKRIQSLFAQFIEDPLYNPVAKEFAQTARDRARVKAAEMEKEKEKIRARRAQANATV
ncbi:hypothetical protein JKF63_04411 [Porcisia hertigi]|uniref:IQ motif and ubiquitin-like domain-containing protein n=1 Tax=Porcisia hertigi TaxID=2761500 RepID=A0A836LAQ9_9TRYP|nr:hypothetical protein JKF63_04411 [Porcisia hertigi]